MRHKPNKNQSLAHDNPTLTPSEQGAFASETRAAVAVCAFLLLAVALVFGQTLGHEFVNCDDQEYVFWNNEVKNGLTLDGVQWAFTANHAANWHPLTWLSHMLDCQLYGPHADSSQDDESVAKIQSRGCQPYIPYAWGHHLTNVLLHAANAILLFLILWRMTGSLWPSAFVAIVFAIHPLRAESVAWVAERKDVLSGLFFMLTLAAYVRYVRRPFSLGRYLTVAAMFALGLMAKPMLVTLPFVLLLLDFWPLGRILSQQSWRRLILEKLPLLALSAASCAMTVRAQRAAINLNEHIDVPSRLANAVVATGDYLVQLFYPANLAAMYPHPLHAISTWRVILALLVLIAISGTAVASWRRFPYLIVGWLWFLGMLLPVIGLVQVGSQAMADRYTYLPQIGLVIALTWGAAQLVALWPNRRWIWGFVAGVGVLSLMVNGWQQTAYWHDSLSLWSHTLACTSKNAWAHHGLGVALTELGRDDDAIVEFRKAVTIRPDFGVSRFNLANTLKRRGEIDAAIAEYREAARLLPDNVNAHFNLGVLLAGREENAAAIVEFQKTLELKPRHGDASYNLAVCLDNEGRMAEAMERWHKTLELQPNNANTLDRIAWMLATCPDASIRNGKQAIEYAQRAVTLSQGINMAPLETLAAAYAETGQFSKAIEIAQQVIATAAKFNDTETIDIVRAQLDLYRSGTPYHEPVSQHTKKKNASDRR